MKQFKSYSGMAAVCAMLTLASCGNDIELTEAQAPAKGEYKVTFTASQESSATRTAVDGTNVVWQTGDAITVFDGGRNNCTFELSKGTGTTLGEFQGTITVTEPKSYCAVYPAKVNARINTNYRISGLSLPVEQVATLNGFDPQAAIMTARNDNADRISSESGDLSLGEFKHVCAFVKVTTTEEYDRITFIANGGESIAGNFTATVGENGIASVTPSFVVSDTVSLKPAEGNTKIAAGTYLIAVLPGTLEQGFTMECITLGDADNQMTKMFRSFNGSTSAFSRHNVVNMGTASETNGWTYFTPTYVDLGLTSGTKWATCNVGASSPEGYGDYFAWGETCPKDNYIHDNYAFYNINSCLLTKYTIDLGYSNNPDGKTTLDPEDDAATANWGSSWRMPTDAEFTELINNCYMEWTDDYKGTNVKGYIVYKAKHPDDKGVQKFGNNSVSLQATYNVSSDVHIFLPASGYRNGSSLSSVSIGNYWSSTLATLISMYANSFILTNNNVPRSQIRNRYYGLSVRPVRP